jgi:hypothetical protein
VAIVDVDCTSDDSKDLCSKYGVRGYPTIKYFTDSTDPMGDAYEGGRTYDDLKKFAEESLGPSCSPDEPNFSEYCSDEQKEAITALKEKGADALKEEVDAAQEAIDTAEKTFKDELAKLQASYEQLSKDKEATIAENSKDLGMKRNVLKSLTAESAAKDEL